MNYIVVSDSFNPYFNLALEECLFEERMQGCILYLWQNEKTVVIGRNQNAYRECDLNALFSVGGKLARRKTGGGAVYHSLGNLCYTFIAPDSLYDEKRQLSLIIDALKIIGVQSHFGGRNDILTEDGKKFSGNAFMHSKGMNIHHGTLLIEENLEDLTKFLKVSKLKMQSKGIKSVLSRVVNLKQVCSFATVPKVKEALIEQFKKSYGETFVLKDYIEKNREKLNEKSEFYRSEKWLTGENPSFSLEYECRLGCGSFEFCLDIKKNEIVNCTVYSDCLDENLPKRLENALKGRTLKESDISEAAGQCLGGEEKDRLVQYFKEFLYESGCK